MEDSELRDALEKLRQGLERTDNLDEKSRQGDEIFHPSLTVAMKRAQDSLSWAGI